jgi:hypothetical protein
MKKLHILITMDVEPPLPAGTRPEGASGPRDIAESTRAIEGYVARAAAHGFPVTMMVHPEVTHLQADLLRRLEAEAGACLGLHLHPWKFSDGRWRAHFGGLDATQQCAILSEAVAMWQAGIGRRPAYFRPGTFSANDFTFGVLDALGLRGGSVSIPGRVFPDLNAVWAGCVPDPHRGHRCFRQLAGDLGFVNIPLSVDLSSVERRGERQFCWDLRPDWLQADYARIASNIVGQVLARDPAVPVVHVVTHNDNDFSDPADRVCRNFVTVLDAIGAACAAHGVEAAGATFADVCALVEAADAGRAGFVAADSTLLTG